jgi:AAA15 family ATPase/GTPase
LPGQIVTPFSHRAGGLISQLWSEVVEADLKQETIDLLRFFDPAIEDVDIILPSERKQLLSIKHKKLGRAPLSTFGDGLRRVFTLATVIPRVKNGLLLIDELEAAVHTKALEKAFGCLVNVCVNNNVQLFATTHSLEALDALLDAARERADFVVYRLQQDEERTIAVRFDKETIVRLREELGMEIRY